MQQTIEQSYSVTSIFKSASEENRNIWQATFCALKKKKIAIFPFSAKLTNVD